jgi:hypothetical protein
MKVLLDACVPRPDDFIALEHRRFGRALHVDRRAIGRAAIDAAVVLNASAIADEVIAVDHESVEERVRSITQGQGVP